MSESHLATRNSVKDLPPSEVLARPGHAREDLLRLLPPETGLPRPVQAGSLPPALATLGLLDARERDVDSSLAAYGTTRDDTSSSRKAFNGRSRPGPGGVERETY